MTDSTPNGTAATVNTIIAAGNTAGVIVVESLIIADFPWIGADPLAKEFLKDILSWLDGYLSRAEQLGATFLVIDSQVNSEESDIQKAEVEIEAAEKYGIPASIQKAIQDYANAQSAFIHNDGSAHSQ